MAPPRRVSTELFRASVPSATFTSPAGSLAHSRRPCRRSSHLRNWRPLCHRLYSLRFPHSPPSQQPPLATTCRRTSSSPLLCSVILSSLDDSLLFPPAVLLPSVVPFSVVFLPPVFSSNKSTITPPVIFQTVHSPISIVSFSDNGILLTVTVHGVLCPYLPSVVCSSDLERICLVEYSLSPSTGQTDFSVKFLRRPSFAAFSTFLQLQRLCSAATLSLPRCAHVGSFSPSLRTCRRCGSISSFLFFLILRRIFCLHLHWHLPSSLSPSFLFRGTAAIMPLLSAIGTQICIIFLILKHLSKI